MSMALVWNTLDSLQVLDKQVLVWTSYWCDFGDHLLSMAVTDLYAYGDACWAWPWCERHRDRRNTGKACHQSETSCVCWGHWWSCIPSHTGCTCRDDLRCDAGCGQPGEPGKTQMVTAIPTWLSCDWPLSITETGVSSKEETTLTTDPFCTGQNAHQNIMWEQLHIVEQLCKSSMKPTTFIGVFSPWKNKGLKQPAKVVMEDSMYTFKARQNSFKRTYNQSC